MSENTDPNTDINANANTTAADQSARPAPVDPPREVYDLAMDLTARIAPFLIFDPRHHEWEDYGYIVSLVAAGLMEYCTPKF